MLAVVPSKVIFSSLIVIISTLMFLTGPAYATGGFHTRNVSPVTQFTGIPVLQSARQLEEGSEYSLFTSINSHFIGDQFIEEEPLFFDGESVNIDFQWRQGFGRFEWEILVPWLKYHGGYLDNFVIDFHDLTGLPGGNREDYDNNDLLFFYQPSSGQEIRLDSSVEGLGDIQTSLGYQLDKKSDYAHALRMGMKFATGNKNDWLGNDAFAISFFSTQYWQKNYLDRDWHLNLQLGLLFTEKPFLISEQANRTMAFYSFSMAFPFWLEGLMLRAQLDGHTRVYKDSEQVALRDVTQISLGGEYHAGEWQWIFSVIEDIYVDSSPDVGFQLGFSRQLKTLR